MGRRNFIKSIGLLGASLPLISFAEDVESEKKITNKTIKPKALVKGDLVGLITPGSFIDDEGLQKAINNIESLGFRVLLGENIRKSRGYNAGTKQERVGDLHSMFSNEEVKAVWAVRGGYGCSGILSLIDFDLIKSNPKIFIGYSDITVLLISIYKKTGLITFHGPVAASDFTNYTKENVLSVLTSTIPNQRLFPSQENRIIADSNENYKLRNINKGDAEGVLIGGNLTLITSLVGTEWAINYQDKVLFLEDVGEAPYKIDRMLIQLNQSMKLSRTKSVLFGVFTSVNKPKDELSLSLKQTLNDNIKDIGIPSTYGLSIGHIDNMLTVPIGVKAKFNYKDYSIELLENTVE